MVEQIKTPSAHPLPTKEELRVFLLRNEFTKIHGKKILLWSAAIAQNVTIKEIINYNGSHFVCKTLAGPWLSIHELIIYQLVKYGTAIDEWGRQSEIIK